MLNIYQHLRHCYLHKSVNLFNIYQSLWSYLRLFLRLAQQARELSKSTLSMPKGISQDILFAHWSNEMADFSSRGSPDPFLLWLEDPRRILMPDLPKWIQKSFCLWVSMLIYKAFWLHTYSLSGQVCKDHMCEYINSWSGKQRWKTQLGHKYCHRMKSLLWSIIRIDQMQDKTNKSLALVSALILHLNMQCRLTKKNSTYKYLT